MHWLASFWLSIDIDGINLLFTLICLLDKRLYKALKTMYLWIIWNIKWLITFLFKLVGSSYMLFRVIHILISLLDYNWNIAFIFIQIVNILIIHIFVSKNIHLPWRLFLLISKNFNFRFIIRFNLINSAWRSPNLNHRLRSRFFMEIYSFCVVLKFRGNIFHLII